MCEKILPPPYSAQKALHPSGGTTIHLARPQITGQIGLTQSCNVAHGTVTERVGCQLKRTFIGPHLTAEYSRYAPARRSKLTLL